VARPALSERRPLGLESAPKTSFRIGFQTQRFPAVRRPEPRHIEESSETLSAPPRLCVETRVGGWLCEFLVSLCLLDLPRFGGHLEKPGY